MEGLKTLDGALNVDKVGVCETSWLTSSTIDSNTDINDISNITEELVEISIGHLKGKVADEESLGWWVLLGGLASGLVLEVDHHSAAFEDGLVLGLDSSLSFCDSFKLNITKTRIKLVQNLVAEKLSTYPLLNCLASDAIVAALIVPN